MHAITSGVKGVGGLLGIRVCLLLVLIFFCAIDRSNTRDPTTRRNRTVVEIAYREVRRTFLELLNRIKSTTASATYLTRSGPNTPVVIVVSVATATTTTAIATPTTPSTTTATTITADPPRKRSKRNSGRENDTFTEDDLVFVENDPEIDENGILRISLFINNPGLYDPNHLYEVAKALNKSGELEAVAPVLKIRLPNELPSVATLQLGFKLWLPILLATVVLLLIFILIFVRYWSARNKKSSETRRINSSVDGLAAEGMDTLREFRGRQRIDFPQHEICAISSNEEATNERITWGKLNLMRY